MGKQTTRPAASLAKKMGISLVCGLVVGLAMLFLRESLTGSGQSAAWKVINDLLFQDITAEGAGSALGIFYLIGQLFIRSLQLIIVPMVFTSITLAIGQISDTRTLGRISAKTLIWFLICSFFALLLACVVGSALFNAGVFTAQIEGLTGNAGQTGSNPLNVILNMVPANIVSAFSSNTAVLAIVFLAVCLGLSMNALGAEKTATLRKLVQELNDVVVVFLNYVINKFGPIAIFMLLVRTFASYGIDYLRPAFAYVVTTVILLLLYLVVGYPLIVAVGARKNPVTFLKKISEVAVFGFSTSSSAAALPLNYKACTEDLGVDETIASFVLPLGMTINMNGTAIMHIIGAAFIATCAGLEVTPMHYATMTLLAICASMGTPAIPAAGTVMLYAVLTGAGFGTELCTLIYSLILAMNKPCEMVLTTLNVVGDAATTVIVAKTENEFDAKVYNS